jgi:hypothetical protein
LGTGTVIEVHRYKIACLQHRVGVVEVRFETGVADASQLVAVQKYNRYRSDRNAGGHYHLRAGNAGEVHKQDCSAHTQWYLLLLTHSCCRWRNTKPDVPEIRPKIAPQVPAGNPLHGLHIDAKIKGRMMDVYIAPMDFVAMRMSCRQVRSPREQWTEEPEYSTKT